MNKYMNLDVTSLGFHYIFIEFIIHCQYVNVSFCVTLVSV